MSCSTGGPQVTCASSEYQAGRDLWQATGVCHPSPPTVFTTHPQKPLTPINSWGSSTVLKTSPTSKYHISEGRRKRDVNILPLFFNHSAVTCVDVQIQHNKLNRLISPFSMLQPQKDQTPVPGNTWKFTACVAVLALCTAMLIVCAIKGPSLYKLFHNYRHRPLHQEEDEEDGVVSTVFSETKRYLTHQTFTFEQEDGRIAEVEEEEEEDGYYEDPYIRREELHTGGEASAEPWRSKHELESRYRMRRKSSQKQNLSLVY